MVGGIKVAAEEENATIDFVFASVVLLKKIQVGKIFIKDNLWVK